MHSRLLTPHITASSKRNCSDSNHFLRKTRGSLARHFRARPPLFGINFSTLGLDCGSRFRVASRSKLIAARSHVQGGLNHDAPSSLGLSIASKGMRGSWNAISTQMQSYNQTHQEEDRDHGDKQRKAKCPLSRSLQRARSWLRSEKAPGARQKQAGAVRAPQFFRKASHVTMLVLLLQHRLAEVAETEGAVGAGAELLRRAQRSPGGHALVVHGTCTWRFHFQKTGNCQRLVNNGDRTRARPLLFSGPALPIPRSSSTS